MPVTARNSLTARVCLAVAVAAMSSTSERLGAAASPPPTVSITRLPALNQGVWPGDFNGDGITDLAASDTTAGGAPGYVLIALGKGDGTFGTPITSTVGGRVLAVGDFNRDGKLDVVAATNVPNGSNSNVSILPGNGDGTLGSSRLLGQFTDLTFALAADFDGDGNRDLFVFTDTGTSYVYTGHGDFTFAPGVGFTTGYYPIDGVVADLNGDGKKDVVVANNQAGTITIFGNISAPGAVNFTETDSPFPGATDVAAGDLNGDGKIDLAVTAASGGDSFSFFTEGYVYTWFGNGDLTFQGTPTQYAVPRGAWQVVVGDFNRDGIVDLATANRSPIYEDCNWPFKTWDTLSILPGNGDGTFAAPSNFSLGNQGDLNDHRYQATVVSLNTSDLNGDHATDLIASWGAIVLNEPAAPNSPPTVDVGPDQTYNGSAELFLAAVASDPDNDMLTYSWTASDGSHPSNVPTPCVGSRGPGTYTFTVTVDDGHGHTASDSVTYTVKPIASPTVTIDAPTAGAAVTAGAPYTVKFGATPGDTPITRIDVYYSQTSNNVGTIGTICSNLPPSATQCTWNDPEPVSDNVHVWVYATDQDGDTGYTDSGQFAIVPGAGSLPSGWQQTDVGAVTAAGSATYDAGSGKWTVTGDGADIWGTADQFHYAYTLITGNFEINTRVDSVQSVNAWTKAGLMIRQTLNPDSAHASIFATPGKGIAFQRRTTTGAASVNTSGPGYTAPVWLRLTKIGTTVTAYYRKNITDLWTKLGSESIAGLPSNNPAYVGIPVTSHYSGRLATATFSGVFLEPVRTWSASAIGNTSSSSAQDGTVLTMTNAGTDIWGTSDSFLFDWNQLTGDGTITARVRSVQNVNAWTKAGVMIRESAMDASAAQSRHVDVVVTPGKGVAMQYRAATGGTSANAGIIAGTAPGWVRLTRHGSTFTGQWSTDGVTWKTVGTATVNMSSTVFFGMAVTSHDAAVRATAAFDDMRIQQ